MTTPITARLVRTCPPETTGLPVPAELWESSEPFNIGSFLQPTSTRHMLLVEENAHVTHRWMLLAATPAGLVDLRHWGIAGTGDKFETRAALLEAAGFTPHTESA